MTTLAELQPLAEKIFADLHDLTFDGVGITRDSYGQGEQAAADYLRELARSEGLETDTDRAANLVFRQPGTQPSDAVSWVGSHIDSVPQGGNFDGLAGVVAGLLCLIARRRKASSDALPLEVMAFRGEESAWFGKAYMGSGALLGHLGETDLALVRRDTKDTLAAHLERTGADVAAIRAGKRLFDQSRVKRYIELHIEQGPVLVEHDVPVGVVSGIRGNIRHLRAVCLGEAQHSGAVPRELRHDAVFGVAHLVVRLDSHWQALLAQGHDLVVTAGVVNTDPAEHSISRVPGRVDFSVEARSSSMETLRIFEHLLREACDALHRERGVRFELDSRMLTSPAVMDGDIRDGLASACEALRVPFMVMPSGAGHDAAGFANAGIPTGMLFVRNQNGSHNPREAMDIRDFMQGVKVMDEALRSL